MLSSQLSFNMFGFNSSGAHHLFLSVLQAWHRIHDSNRSFQMPLFLTWVSLCNIPFINTNGEVGTNTFEPWALYIQVDLSLSWVWFSTQASSIIKYDFDGTVLFSHGYLVIISLAPLQSLYTSKLHSSMIIVSFFNTESFDGKLSIFDRVQKL